MALSASGHGRPNLLAGGLRLAGVDVQIAGIQGHQQLARAHAIAGLYLHLAHVAHQLAAMTAEVRARTVPVAS